MTSVFDDFARSGNEASDAEPADDPPVSPPAKRKGATPAAPGPVGNGKASASAKHRSDADTITRELRPHTAPVKPASSALVKGGADRPPESKALQPSETRKPASRALADTKRASKPPVFRSVGFLAAPECQYIVTQPVHGRKARASPLPEEVQQEADELKIKAQALRQSGNMREEALHYFRLASLFFHHGHFEQSIVFAEKFRAIVTAGGDIIATALALNYLGANYFYLGQTTSYADQGIEHVRQAVDFHRRQHELTPDLVSRYVANCNLGVCFLALNESLGATTHYKQALEASTQLNDPEAQSIVYDLLAANSEKAKDYGSAKQFLDKRLRVAEALKDRQTVAEVHKRLGSLLLSWRGTFEEDARRHFDIASQFETAQADPFDDEELMSHADDLALEDGPAAANGHDSEYDDAGSFASDVDLDDSRERAYDTGPESGGEPGPEYQSDSDFSVFGNYESKLDRNRSLKAKAATSGTTFDSRKATSSRPVVKKKQDSGSLSDTEFKSRKKSFD